MQQFRLGIKLILCYQNKLLLFEAITKPQITTIAPYDFSPSSFT